MNARRIASLSVLLVALPTAARADFGPPHRVDLSSRAKRKASDLSTRSAEALMRADYPEAVKLADQAIDADASNPWPYYDRAEALAAEKRVDEAVRSFRQAEARFGDDPWGRSVAVYGRALALDQAGRCDEARVVYDAYAALVNPYEPSLARTAQTYGQECGGAISVGAVSDKSRVASRAAPTPARKL
jgi:tetratricopeptide (TPR) repeat protein